jgi:hypothetical protein
MTTDQILSMARAALNILGTILLTYGYIKGLDAETWSTISGAVLTLVGVARRGQAAGGGADRRHANVRQQDPGPEGRRCPTTGGMRGGRHASILAHGAQDAVADSRSRGREIAAGQALSAGA